MLCLLNRVPVDGFALVDFAMKDDAYAALVSLQVWLSVILSPA